MLSSIEVPKQYRVAFRAGDAEQRQFYDHYRFIMPISVGQEVHEGAKIAEIFNFVREKFPCGGCVLIDDTIQRHTQKILTPTTDDDALWQACWQDGEDWLERNRQHCHDKNGTDYRIVRWSYFTDLPEFPGLLELVHEKRLSLPLYNHSFKKTIDIFVDRMVKRYPHIDIDFAREQCMTYLEEECAVMLLWPTLSVDVEVYPAARNPVMAATNHLILADMYEKPLYHAGLRFHNRQ